MSNIKYDVKSEHAAEFIHDGEIRDTLAWAREHRNDRALIDEILAKADQGKGISHREAAVLIEVEDPEIEQRIFAIARRLKEQIYGNRIVMFAPLYLSNHCVNGCVYCPYHAKNKTIPRRKLTQEEIRREVIALQDMGHKRLALETGEHPKLSPIEYVLESIDTIYSIHHKNGAIRRVNVNIAATTVENYTR
ncbi:MAG: [Alistipes sp.]|nr:[FeFe] hydrogenase H-cluster radical SAM maturase HydG [Alistipes sp.]